MFLGPPPGFPQGPNGGPALPFGPQASNGREQDRGRLNPPPPAIMEREHTQQSTIESREAINERPHNRRPSPLNLPSPTMKSGRHVATTPPTTINQSQPSQNVIRPSTSGKSSCHSSPSPKEHLSSSNLSMVLNSFQLNYDQVIYAFAFVKSLIIFFFLLRLRQGMDCVRD